jgi:hypothetical protein
MKAILGTLAVSISLPLSLSAQVSSGGAGTAAGASGSSSIAAGAARSAGVAGSGAISPTGSLAGQTPTGTGAGTVTTPSGTPIATPGTAAPVGPINPGGIAGRPPASVGRTFDRPIIGGGPTDVIVDPAATQPTFRFPPSSTLPTPVVTNTVTSGAGGFPESTFPSGPVGVNNTVGTNFGRVLTSAAPREPVAINLPPGTRIVTNAFGVSEVVAPPPVLVPTNVGRSPTLERGFDRGVVIPRTVPPVEVPRVSRGPILDRRSEVDR